MLENSEKKESGAFAKAYAKDWLKDWFETRPNSKPIGYWTHERCEEEAKRYTSYSNLNANNYVVYSQCSVYDETSYEYQGTGRQEEVLLNKNED